MHASTGLWRRDESQSIQPGSSSLSYNPPSGAWTSAILDSGSCAQSAESSITPGSSIALSFTGTSVVVNVLKNTNGVPYNVTLDNQVSQFDAYSVTEQCASDFRATDLSDTGHSIVITHDGSSSLAANGRSTLDFVSFDITGTPSAPQPTSSATSKSSTPIGAIVGGILGALALAILMAALWCYWRRRRRSPQIEVTSSHKENEIMREPYDLTQAQPYIVPDRQDPNSGSDPTSTTMLVSQRRTKGTEANSNPRYVRSSPWASQTSQNRSRPNVGDEPGTLHNAANSGYSGSSAPSGGHPYPPGSATEVTEDAEDSTSTSPRVMHIQSSLINQQPQPSRSDPASLRPVPVPAPAPSTVGESVLIDDPNYVPPPSYSPGPTNHPRHTSPMRRSKAAYEGTSSGSSNALSPSSMPLFLQNPSQALSQDEVDVIARRVVDMLRSGSSGAESSVLGAGTSTGSDITMSTSDISANPQVQQAVRVLLGREDHPTSSDTPEAS